MNDTPGTREPALTGQTVVVIGGSAGIGLETARLAAAEGADVIITGRTPEKLERAAADVGASSTAAFDATDFDALDTFLEGVPGPIDHMMVTAGGPYYAPLAELDFDAARRNVEEHMFLPIRLGRFAIGGGMRAGGSIALIGGTGARQPGPGLSIMTAMTGAMSPLISNLAVEIAPVRINVIAAGFVDTPLSASLLGDQLEARRQQLRDTLPIRRVVGPEDVAALGVHLMTNTALTGATYDIDGGQQFVPK